VILLGYTLTLHLTLVTPMFFVVVAIVLYVSDISVWAGCTAGRPDSLLSIRNWANTNQGPVWNSFHHFQLCSSNVQAPCCQSLCPTCTVQPWGLWLREPAWRRHLTTINATDRWHRRRNVFPPCDATWTASHKDPFCNNGQHSIG
jgi:hypothetical protein